MLKQLPAGNENRFQINITADFEYVTNRFGVSGWKVTLSTGRESSQLSTTRSDAVELAAFLIKLEITKLIAQMQTGKMEF